MSPRGCSCFSPDSERRPCLAEIELVKGHVYMRDINRPAAEMLAVETGLSHPSEGGVPSVADAHPGEPWACDRRAECP